MTADPHEPGAHVHRDGHHLGEPGPDPTPRAQNPADPHAVREPGREVDLFRVTYRLVEDLQRVRLSHGNRIRLALPHIPPHINPPRGTPSWEAFFATSAEILDGEEKRVLKLAERLLRDDPTGRWLLGQRGIGPALAISILGECWPLTRFKNPAKLWAYAGLAVHEGQAVRRRRGVRSTWNSRLKTRLWVFAQSFMKTGGPWRELYDQRKAYEYTKVGAQKDVGAHDADEPDPTAAGAQSHDDTPAENVPRVGAPRPVGPQQSHAPDAGAHVVNATRASIAPCVGAQERSDARDVGEPDAPAGAQDDDGPQDAIEPGRPFTKLHLHNRAIRYVEKALLLDLWRVAHDQPPLIGGPR